MTDDIKKVLAEAAPRPWTPSTGMREFIDIPSGKGVRSVAAIYGRIPGEMEATRDLIVLAVNSYEANQERIRVLTEALRKLANEASGFRCNADINRHGTTNMRVLGDRITEAFDVLAALSQSKPDTGGQP